MTNERKELILFWLSFCNLFRAWKIVPTMAFVNSLPVEIVPTVAFVNSLPDEILEKDVTWSASISHPEPHYEYEDGSTAWKFPVITLLLSPRFCIEARTASVLRLPACGACRHWHPGVSCQSWLHPDQPVHQRHSRRWLCIWRLVSTDVYFLFDCFSTMLQKM